MCEYISQDIYQNKICYNYKRLNMSDYDDYGYEEPQEDEEEQKIQTVLEFENCQAEQYLRQKNFEEALKAFQDIYEKANQHDIKSWKSKALSQMLEMHVQMGNGAEARKTLHDIREMNEVDKTNEQSVKSIIKTLNSVERNIYQSFWDDIFALISGLEEEHAQLKCYFLMLEKEIQEQNIQKSKIIFDRAQKIFYQISNLSVASEFQMFYLQTMYLKLQKIDLSQKLRQIYIKLPQYEQDTSVNEIYISKIKQQMAPILYLQQNFAQCSNFLCSFYVENSKYGSNNERNKELIKINLLMVLLSGDLTLLEDRQFNPMLQESIVAYKLDSDIQALYSLAEAFKAQEINLFEEILSVVKLILPKNSPYGNLQKRVLLELKKQKIASICKCYKNVKFSYIQRRVNENDPKVIQSLLFSLITSKKINGVIHLQDQYLQILPEQNTFYTVQLENLKDLTERM